jgi:hypothetical protein
MDTYTYEIITRGNYGFYDREETNNWQTAIDKFNEGRLRGSCEIVITLSGVKGDVKVVRNIDDIQHWSLFLMEMRKFETPVGEGVKEIFNRVERRIMNELMQQEEDGMKIVEPQESYDDLMMNKHCPQRQHKEQGAEGRELIDEEDHSYDDYIRTVYRETAADKSNVGMVKPDFHGEFSDMEDSLQDAIINPKHYKLFSKEDYSAYPNGIEYMDLCDKALAHLSGVEAHLVGQILKYTLRVGKKDAMEQDAKKIEWYATRLVNTVKEK